MPVLHKYKDREKYYVLTSISGKIVTFQLTAEGHEKLLESGIKNEERFGRALLFDLYRTGDAFTHGAGPGKLEGTDKRQLALDFADDRGPGSIFPLCSVCSSINDLHLVEVNDKEHFAGIYCREGRKIRSATINTSIPLPLINRGLLNRVLATAIFIPYAAPGSKTKTFCRELLKWGKRVYTTDNEKNTRLIETGIKTVSPEIFDK